jgi:hypothetical protein
MSPSLVLAVMQLSLGSHHSASPAPARSAPHGSSPAPASPAPTHSIGPVRRPSPHQQVGTVSQPPPSSPTTKPPEPPASPGNSADGVCRGWGCGDADRGYSGWRGTTWLQNPVEPWDAGAPPEVQGFTGRHGSEPSIDPNAPDTCTPDAASPSHAEAAPEATLYRWVDADGTVNYADAESIPEQLLPTATRTRGEAITVQPALHCHKLGAPDPRGKATAAAR